MVTLDIFSSSLRRAATELRDIYCPSDTVFEADPSKSSAASEAVESALPEEPDDIMSEVRIGVAFQ